MEFVSHYADNGRVKLERYLKSFEVAMKMANITDSVRMIEMFGMMLCGEAVDFIDDVKLEATQPDHSFKLNSSCAIEEDRTTSLLCIK
ncbi:hypothetical protein R1flu_026027 [Riccia fluitans]|uniref:Retrotransposon gag domain-containing protein n=1 Tax=Riccia fluitans TaxID=41844 RepID=A0ABD1XFC6_9MARC